MADDILDLKIAASEARTDTKFAELRGDMRTSHAELLGEIRAMRADISGDLKAVNARLESVEKSTSGIRFNVWMAAISSILALAALLYALITFGGDQLSRGADWQSRIQSEVQRQMTPPQAPIKTP